MYDNKGAKKERENTIKEQSRGWRREKGDQKAKAYIQKTGWDSPSDHGLRDK